MLCLAPACRCCFAIFGLASIRYGPWPAALGRPWAAQPFRACWPAAVVVGAPDCLPGPRPTRIQPHPTCAPPPPPQLILGTSTPLPVMASLIPIMLGVAAASAAELSFNWMGFLTAMASNLTFGFRAVWSKK